MLHLTSRGKRPRNRKQNNLLPLEFLPDERPFSNVRSGRCLQGVWVGTFSVSKSSGMPQAMTSAFSGVYRMYLNFVGGNLSPAFKGAIVLQLMDAGRGGEETGVWGRDWSAGRI